MEMRSPFYSGRASCRSPDAGFRRRPLQRDRIDVRIPGIDAWNDGINAQIDGIDPHEPRDRSAGLLSHRLLHDDAAGLQSASSLGRSHARREEPDYLKMEPDLMREPVLGWRRPDVDRPSVAAADLSTEHSRICEIELRSPANTSRRCHAETSSAIPPSRFIEPVPVCAYRSCGSPAVGSRRSASKRARSSPVAPALGDRL